MALSLRSLLPVAQPVERRGRKRAQSIDIDDQKALPKLFKVISLAVGFTGGTYSLGFHRINFEPAPYDLNRILQAIDTDSYVKQAFHKYQELIWKEGWAIVGENTEAVDYLYNRIAYMELSMGRPFQEFLFDVADQLIKFSNCFIVKVRGNLNPYFPQSLKSTNGANPVVGYQIIPGETMEVMRDYHNKVIMYRQNVWGSYGYSAAAAGFGRDQRDYANLLPTWKPEELIHITLDKKPGRIFGTPFLVAVMDDIIALRQIEEDIQNLVHRELFPLYKYTVGTELHPAEPEEIEAAAQEISGLRTEGAIVLPDRHDVEVIGGEGKVLDAQPYLNHFKERVAIGLGLSPYHLGMTELGGNRSLSDNVDQAIYDKVKLIQALLAENLQLRIFNEVLLEGGYDPYVPNAENSDKCTFQFNEIDVDTQIKKENHIIQKWTSDMITWAEMRLAVKNTPGPELEDLYTSLTERMKPAPGRPVRLADQSAPSLGKGAGGGPKAALNPSTNKPPQLTTGGNSNTPNKPDAGTPSGGRQPNRANRNRKAIANKARPANQHGRLTSPNVRHSEFNEAWLDECVDLLDTVEKGYGYANKVSKKAAAYRPANDVDSCGSCENMLEDGTCLIVEGHVSPDYVCDLYTPDLDRRDNPNNPDA